MDVTLYLKTFIQLNSMRTIIFDKEQRDVKDGVKIEGQRVYVN